MAQIRRRALALLLVAFTLPAGAADQKSASITVMQPWSRATPPGATVGAAYFSVVSTSGADTLLRVESPVAARVEMHTHIEKDGRSQMRQVPTVPVPARGRVEFAPGGLHVMLIDLRAPLKQGTRIPLTLVFEKAGRVQVEAAVQSMGAASPAPADTGGHEHHHH